MIIGYDGSGPVTLPPPPKPPSPPADSTATGAAAAQSSAANSGASSGGGDSVCTAQPPAPDLYGALWAMHAAQAAGSTPAPQQPSSLASDIHNILDAGPGWSTIVGTAHAVYTAPDEIVGALNDAAEKNQNVADAITGLAKNWSSMSPAEHAASARDLLALGEHTSGVQQAAQVIADANQAPQQVADAVAAWSQGNALQRFAAGAVDSTLGKAIFNRTVNALPEQASSALADTAQTYAAQAAEDTAKAASITGKLPFVQGLGTTLGDLAKEHANAPGSSLLSGAKVVGDIPVAGAIITTGAAAFDIGVDHENPGTAIVKEYGSAFASQVAYNVTRNGLNKLVQGGSEAAADAAEATAAGSATDAVAAGGADALTEAGGAVILDSGPAGWAVAGGLAAAVAVGYAATKFVEGSAKDFGAAVTQGGGEMLDGIKDGNVSQIADGAETTVKDVGKGFFDGAKAVGKGFASVGKSIGSAISSIF